MVSVWEATIGAMRSTAKSIMDIFFTLNGFSYRQVSTLITGGEEEEELRWNRRVLVFEIATHNKDSESDHDGAKHAGNDDHGDGAICVDVFLFDGCANNVRVLGTVGDKDGAGRARRADEGALGVGVASVVANHVGGIEIAAGDVDALGVGEDGVGGELVFAMVGAVGGGGAHAIRGGGDVCGGVLKCVGAGDGGVAGAGCAKLVWRGTARRKDGRSGGALVLGGSFDANKARGLGNAHVEDVDFVPVGNGVW